MNNDLTKHKTTNGFKCLGQCYYPGSTIIHPITFEKHIVHIEPTCAVVPFMKDNIITYFDKCINPTANKNENLETNILVPEIIFDELSFLKIYYDIFSMEDALNYIDKNKYNSIFTKIRIMNLTLKCFYEEINIIDQRFVDFIIEYIKKIKIKKIYYYLHTYIGYSDDKKSIMYIDPKNNNLKVNELCIERTNYLLEIINSDNITKFLIKYFKNIKYSSDNIENYLNNLINNLIDYLQKKINISN